MNSNKIRDFRCFSRDDTSISNLMSEKAIPYPDAYKKYLPMSELSIEYRKTEDDIYCVLPFSHTIEAEAMGADINYGVGDGFGLRARTDICSEMKDILELCDIDFEKEPAGEVLSAIRYLKSKGEKVILEVSGPFIIMDFLIDTKKVYKSVRKQDEVGHAVFDKLKRNILNYVKEAIKAGADVISYADSSAGVSILGPRLVEKSYSMFTRDFLLELQKIAAEEKVLIHLCPKTVQIVLAMEGRGFTEIELESEETVTYEEAMLEIESRIKTEKLPVFMGQMCINMKKTKMFSGKIKMLELLEE